MYNQSIENVRAILENTNQKLNGSKKGEDLNIRTSAMEQLRNERKNYNSLVDSWNIQENERNILKGAFNKIVEGSLSAAQKSDFGMAVILDDRQFKNFYNNELWQINKFEPNENS